MKYAEVVWTALMVFCQHFLIGFGLILGAGAAVKVCKIIFGI